MCDGNLVLWILWSTRYGEIEPKFFMPLNRTDSDFKSLNRMSHWGAAWFKQERGDNIPVRGPLHVIIFFLPKC